MEAIELLNAARQEMAKRVVGQGEMVDGLLTALIAGGHILLEGVPGLAKTRAVKTLAEITGLVFKRIQFTPDLLPADLTGTLVWEQATGAFSMRRGPVFANVILADEINRAPAKVQSALLEAMEEKQVTIGEKSYPLPSPFFVLATQNPIEHEGTYALPEAELDRFLLKLLVRYPDLEEEQRILSFAAPFGEANNGGAIIGPEGEEHLAKGGAKHAVVKHEAARHDAARTGDARNDDANPDDAGHDAAALNAAGHDPAKISDTKTGVAGSDSVLNPVLGHEALRTLRQAADAVFVDDQIQKYIVSVVAASRPAVSRPGAEKPGRTREGLYRYIAFGASPRATIALYRCSKIRALFEGRAFVTPEDVKAAAFPVLRHRLVLSYEAEADGLESDTVVNRILTLVPMP
ncbi:MAG: AAA family ATPase [Treponema sp.]|jgi:MoxR-like ATPase|nr:AAA family ATPase [Treponema sp.]